MQFKEKLMNQTSENGEKPNFGLDFGLFRPNLWPEFFFMEFILLFLSLFIYSKSGFAGH